jgi:hypothetical protein
MIKALPTQIRLPNGQVQSQRWGLPEVSRQQVHFQIIQIYFLSFPDCQIYLYSFPVEIRVTQTSTFS